MPSKTRSVTVLPDSPTSSKVLFMIDKPNLPDFRFGVDHIHEAENPKNNWRPGNRAGLVCAIASAAQTAYMRRVDKAEQPQDIELSRVGKLRPSLFCVPPDQRNPKTGGDNRAAGNK